MSLCLFCGRGGGIDLLKLGFLIWGSFCSRFTGLLSIVSLSINFSIVFSIISNLISLDEEAKEVDGIISSLPFLLSTSTLGFIFPHAIILTSTSKEFVNITGRLVVFLSLNNNAKSLSNPSA